MVMSLKSFHMRRFNKAIAVLVIGAFLTSCASQVTSRVDTLTPDNEGEKVSIVVLPVDAEISTLTAGGLLEPNAEWTTAAIENIGRALSENRTVANYELNVIKLEEVQVGSRISDIIEINRALAQTVSSGPYVALPTKKDSVLDWSIGEYAKQLHTTYDADYALMLYARNSHATGGRVAMGLLAAAAGVSINLGQKFAYATLIDTRTGHVVWVNGMLPAPDFRKMETTVTGINKLVQNLPQSES